MSTKKGRYNNHVTQKAKFSFICEIYFCIIWRWDLACLVGFIILGTPRQGVKTARSGPPRSIKHFKFLNIFFCDSLSEETLLVETTRALSQTPATTRYTTCQNKTSDYYNYALSEGIVGQILVYENPNDITVRKDMRTSISSANAIEFLSY